VRLWRDRWIEMAQPEIAGSVSLLTALKARGVPVFALSNFGVESFAVAVRTTLGSTPSTGATCRVISR
jgi:2-haloacid dehalogenase